MEHNNPFFFGGVVREKDFCDRRGELSSLERDVLSGMNVLVYAPRRYGKTSLLFALLSRLEGKDITGIYIDLFPVSSDVEFTEVYFSKVVRALETRADRVIRLLKETLGFKPSFSVEVDPEGRTRFKLALRKEERNKAFEEVVDLPYRYAERTGKKLCIVMDEFQEVHRLGLDAKLRSVLQRHSRKVSYVFSGSKRSILERLFSDRKVPFYGSVKKLPLEPIHEEDWLPFVKGKFEETGKGIDEEFVVRAVRLLEGHPQGVQQFFHFLWEETEKTVDEEVFERATRKLLEAEKDVFWFMWEELTNVQRNTLKLIAHTDGVEIYRRENLERFGLGPNTVQKAVKSLIEKDVLYRKGKRIVFQSPMMKLWLKSLTP
ncbi:AAA family ATPase [Hydrogenivirga sp.]